MESQKSNKKALHRKRSILGILSGMALGYVFALDVTGWYFLVPWTLFLFELIGAFFLYRITHGLLQDEKISNTVKTGYLWAICGLIAAHILSLMYIYTNDGSASFSLNKIDFAESLVISWLYMHVTIFSFLTGTFFEAMRVRRQNLI